MAIGGDSSEDEIPRPTQYKTVQISAGQFEDEDEGPLIPRSKDMSTDYDPPTRYENDLEGMSSETLKLLEREMGMSSFGKGGIAGMMSSMMKSANVQVQSQKEETKKKP